jgi:hypothetical protein
VEDEAGNRERAHALRTRAREIVSQIAAAAPPELGALFVESAARKLGA